VEIIHGFFRTIEAEGCFASLIPPAAERLLLSMISLDGVSRDTEEDSQQYDAEKN